MSSAKREALASRVIFMLHEWDNCCKLTRKKILRNFIANNQSKTGPEIEEQFAHASSLFLARISAWLRLSYMHGFCLLEQLQALLIFLSSTSGHNFIVEFVEVGGVFTLLDILALKQCKEINKVESLACLHQIAMSGRKYKELICESYGIRAIAECLAKVQTEEAQQASRNLLMVLAHGNPKFQVHVYKGFIALLPCSSPAVQQIAAKSLRTIQAIVEEANPSIVEPVLNLLRSLHTKVQVEAADLIKELVKYDVCHALLSGLVSLLHPVLHDEEIYEPVVKERPVTSTTTPLPIFLQQAAAAKTISLLAGDSDELSKKFLQLPVVCNLMYAMGNTDYIDSQRQASITLQQFCKTSPAVDSQVRLAMGDTLYALFSTNPEILAYQMDRVQADILVSNKVRIDFDQTNKEK